MRDVGKHGLRPQKKSQQRGNFYDTQTDQNPEPALRPELQGNLHAGHRGLAQGTTLVPERGNRARSLVRNRGEH